MPGQSPAPSPTGEGGKQGIAPLPSRWARAMPLPLPPPQACGCRRASPAGSREAAYPPPPPGQAPTPRGGRGWGLQRQGPAAPHTPAAAPGHPLRADRPGGRWGRRRVRRQARGAERAGRQARKSGGTRPLPAVRPAPAAASPLLFLRRQNGGTERGRLSPTPARPALPPASLLAWPVPPHADWAAASAAVARGAGAGGGRGVGVLQVQAALGSSGPRRPRSAARPGCAPLPRKPRSVGGLAGRPAS